MTNNDVLRRIRYIFDYSDKKMMAIFSEGGLEVTRERISQWLKKEDAPDYASCNDYSLASFLNGLIVHKRGKREGELPVAEKQLGNNAILKKLKIALNFRSDDILEILQLAGLSVSQHELSAFFRKPGHKHYRECKDQFLRNFLHGLQLRYRSGEASTHFKWES